MASEATLDGIYVVTPGSTRARFGDADLRISGIVPCFENVAALLGDALVRFDRSRDVRLHAAESNIAW